jgi:signal transduction histidine kinase
MDNDIGAKYLLTRESLHPDLYGDFNSIENLEFIQEVLNLSTHLSAVINRDRQVILSNIHLVKMAGVENLDQLIGKRPGEIISCLHEYDNIGCGTSESCQFCGIIQTIIQSQAQSKRITNECRITTSENYQLIFYDFRVTCSPVFFNGEMYTLMNLEDISSEKRNAILENIFFHDVLNRLGGLTGIIHVIKTENKQHEIAEYIDLLETISEMTIEEIQSQRHLKAAENNNLILNIQEHSAFDIIESVRKQIAFHPVMNSLSMILDTGCVDFKLYTDSTLLKRILLNMTKNAAEASPEDGTIRIHCLKKSGTALFSVNNQGMIPYDVQLQIFQRSYSTKGYGRGLGTYSMKLFGENYLKGKVYFTSDEKEGTTFTIELPVE